MAIKERLGAKEDVARRLRERFGDWAHYNKKNPLDELLFILCSIQTDEDKYIRAYSALRARYPRAAELQRAELGEIAQILAPAGLAQQKAKAIKGLLSQILERFGSVSLSSLQHLSDSQCEEFLTSLSGVGRKSARCVMMYSLGRDVFPVDTHCWRIARRLGWIRSMRPDKSCSPKDMDRLQASIPKEIRFSLHVNMISLGRTICLPSKPRCSECPLQQVCKGVGVGTFV